MRMTRAALRAQALDDSYQIHQDADSSDLGPQPETPNKQPSQGLLNRTVLKDITQEINSTVDDVFAQEPLASAKKPQPTGNETQPNIPLQGVTPKLQEGSVSDSSDSAPQEAQYTANQTPQHGSYMTSQEDLPQPPSTLPHHSPRINQQLPDITKSPLPQLSTNPPKTPKFDPSIHLAREGNEATPTQPGEDSFIDNIKSRSPSKMHACPGDSIHSPDSFSDHMNPRTPRIEDSVEAIDALEEAIEKISEGLPVLDNLNIQSPIKSAKKAPSRVGLENKAKAPASVRRSAKPPGTLAKSSPAKPSTTKSTTVRSRPSIAQSAVGKQVAKPPTVARQSKKPVVDGQSRSSSTTLNPPPSLSFSNSPAKALPNTTKKRVPSTSLSTSKPGFVPARSSKAPTTSTFSLPGEAISAKVRAQREERLRREEEELKAKKLFKARPLPTKAAEPTVKPRANKASQARLSIYAGGVNKENVEPQRQAGPRPRPSSMLISRPKPEVAKANSSVRRTMSVMERPMNSKPRVSSVQLAAGQKLSVSKEDAVRQRANGKEVFARSKVEKERLEKERKEKEEATRKARAEAAERGRQASREWAEKKKKRLTLQANTKLHEGSSTAVSTTS
ncbi:hypothetical protein PV10_01702 [Exophiala mesophila]|uniref:Carboxylesterase family protein n=1 Tax=Exophiala mesophila TaxID=212818 RepID=A0A0D2AGJ5_EXOME|nr:uncharacterized protein PV10_01702 [Exophiala mesophila]KIV98008.1 hypothetical protein PV10_01702 [Exophiala mesophila]